MYRIPTDVDLNKLLKKRVTQISFGLNYVLISFDEISIQFSGPHEIGFHHTKTQRDEVFPANSDNGILNFLERTVEQVTCNNERTSLTLNFGIDMYLVIASNKQYECFEIFIDGKREII